MNAPLFSLRQQAVAYSLGGIILAFGAADAGMTILTIGIAVGVVVLFVAAMVGQHYAEGSGAVERERERQEQVWAKRATWSAGQQLAFRVFVGLVFVAIIVKGFWAIVF